VGPSDFVKQSETFIADGQYLNSTCPALTVACEMVDDIDMLAAPSRCRVVQQSNCTLIVTVHRSARLLPAAAGRPWASDPGQ
jgi:hypothetical protein